MHIGLHPVDSKMANLALMKLSMWHKSKGHSTELFMPLWDYDKVYVSKIFDHDPLPNDVMCDNVEYGGTGYDVSKTLLNEVEFCDPDYSLYPNCNYSIQLFSRGCIRNCSFCVVRQKEGLLSPRQPMAMNPNGEYVELFDNNFFANPNWREAIDWLESNNQPVNFQGVDARLLTNEMCHALLRVKHKKQIHMAWDNPKQKIEWDGITSIIPAYKIMVYVLIGYNSTEKEDIYRVETLRNLGIDPFVMPYNKKNEYQKRFARWVNHKAVFKTVKWEDYGQA